MTAFYAFDIDTNDNIILGGETYDTNLVDIKSANDPLFLYIVNGNLYKWAKYLSTNTDYERVTAVAFDPF